MIPVKITGKKYTPLEAIHKHCVECVGGDRKMLKDCGGKRTCFLYEYRYGRRPSTADYSENGQIEAEKQA